MQLLSRKVLSNFEIINNTKGPPWIGPFKYIKKNNSRLEKCPNTEIFLVRFYRDLHRKLHSDFLRHF